MFFSVKSSTYNHKTQLHVRSPLDAIRNSFFDFNCIHDNIHRSINDHVCMHTTFMTAFYDSIYHAVVLEI